jgi:SAM-dependent methyltransferase
MEKPNPDNYKTVPKVAASSSMRCGNAGAQALGQEFWNNRYLTQQTGWDLGTVSPPLKAYAGQLARQDLRILIPGCGNSYEAEYLLQQGFTQITLLDIAPALVEALQQKFAGKPQVKVLLEDYFSHQDVYDLVLEQTFFCALDPALRPAYARKTAELLAPDGKLAGVLFNREFDRPGPPFGGSREEYEKLFSPFFRIKTLETCYNSARPRQGTELFMILQPKTGTARIAG